MADLLVQHPFSAAVFLLQLVLLTHLLFLSQIHKYLKGDYTIFPIRKEENKLPIKAENVVKQKKINPVVNNEENIVKEK